MRRKIKFDEMIYVAHFWKLNLFFSLWDVMMADSGLGEERKRKLISFVLW